MDYRQGSGELTDKFAEAVEVELDYGDFMFYGKGPEGEMKIGVERKRIRDLLNSIQTGRLSGKQIPRMLEEYDRSYLVVEGLWRPNWRTGFLQIRRGGKWFDLKQGRKFKYGDVWSFLSAMEEMFGVRVRMTLSPKETIACVENLAAWWNKEWEKHKSHEMMHNVVPQRAVLNPVGPSIIRRVAAQLPGIGHDRSKAVEERFETIMDMAFATVEDWMEVDGIGKVGAEKAWNAINLGR